MLAYAVFAAHLCFRSWPRRVLFVAIALAATVLANALRAWGTMVAAEIWGIERAAGIDHIFYGWIFFGLVILAVMLGARRWFDRPAGDAAVDVSRLGGPVRYRGDGRAILPVALAIPLLFIGWAALVGGRSAPLPATMPVETPAGWHAAAAQGLPWVPRFDGADQRLLRHFADAKGRRVAVAVGGYERQAEGARSLLSDRGGRSGQQMGVERGACPGGRRPDRAAASPRPGASRRRDLVCRRRARDRQRAGGEAGRPAGAAARRRPARAVADRVERGGAGRARCDRRFPFRVGRSAGDG